MLTVSHLRFGPQPIRSAYLVEQGQLRRLPRVGVPRALQDARCTAVPGATFLLNCPFPAEEVWDRLPYESQARIIELGLKVYAINAYEVAKKTGMGGRINTIMQTCFFYLSGIIPPDEAIAAIKKAIKKTYGKRGEKVVQHELQRRGPGHRQPARDQGARAWSTQHVAQAPAGARRTPRSSSRT